MKNIQIYFDIITQPHEKYKCFSSKMIKKLFFELTKDTDNKSFYKNFYEKSPNYLLDIWQKQIS